VFVEFLLLGPLVVRDDRGREVRLSSRKQRLLLSLLLLHAGEVVSRQLLFEALWPEGAPATAATALQGHVSRLRRLLGTGRLVTEAPGYRLEPGEDVVDIVVFERLLAEAPALTEASLRAERLRSALALWRGRPLPEFAAEEFARAELERLDGLWALALEERLAAELDDGRAVELVPELEPLVRARPLQERLRALLMLALYRAGRQADALEAYRAGRELLVDELGVEPGPELQQLQRRILGHDPALGAGVTGEAAAPREGLPEGTVTTLFTDIEGSTRLLRKLGTPAYREELELHHELLRRVFTRHGGREVELQGDGFHVAFARASAAVAAAAELQLALAEADWPHGEAIRVRVGLHTGEPAAVDVLYVGLDIHRAARVTAAAHGGQVLLSETTAALVRDELPPELELRDLGRYRLKDFPQPQRLYQLGAGTFPPVRTLGHEEAATRQVADDEASSASTAAVASARRRRVTIASFALVGLGDDRDAEVVERRLQAFFEHTSAVVRRHGGTVQVFTGDTVVAAFGFPTAYEDDGLRAVRAALDVRTELATPVSAGVSSGEVVTGSGRAIGEPGVVASRLQRQAEAGEILIGASTWRLVRDAVRVEVLAGGDRYRLLEVIGGAAPFARRDETPFVGRDDELSRLEQAFGRCTDDRRCCLFTVLGPAGVGKSRLAAEAHLRFGDRARILTGHCLPYGEGITFWPLREMIEQAFGAEFESAVPGAVAGLIGDEPAGVALEESFLAVRHTFEKLADERPLVVIVEDLHWAESTLLDLIEQLADLVRDAPILLLCLARLELLDRRPGWAGGKTNATSILLDSLSDAASRELAAWLAASEDVSEQACASAVKLAEGNPLFLEQLIVHARDRSVADEALPPTIDALLTARLDRLAPAELELAERAALIGRDFDLDAVGALAGEPLRESIVGHVEALVRKEMIRPTRDRATSLETYRFRHVLIRDTAYRGMPKELRSELHRRYADWLEGNPADAFADEIVGYHLESAHAYAVELGLPEEETRPLAARASTRLDAAGRHAVGRGDLPAAISLFERVVPLLLDDASRASLLGDLGATLTEAGELDRAHSVLDESRRLARDVGDDAGEAGALVQLQLLDFLRSVDGSAGRGTALLARAIPVFERHDDHRGLCRGWRLRALLDWAQSNAARAADAWDRAASYARLAGDEHAYMELQTWIATALFFGPMPVGEGIARCEAMLDSVARDRGAKALVVRALAGLHAFAGHSEASDDLFAASNAAMEELGLTLDAATSQLEAMIDLLTGDPIAAEESLRVGYAALESIGERFFLSTTAALLARALFAQGRLEEADDLAAESAELAASDDLITQMLWRTVRARIRAEQGQSDDAEHLAREAVTMGAGTDFINHQADAIADLAEILNTSGRAREAHDSMLAAVRLYRDKGNVVAEKSARSRLVVLEVM
jgi:class 3 adenylate cyclase